MRFKSLRTRITVWTITAMLFTPVTVGVVILVKQFTLASHFSKTIEESDNILKATLLRDLERAMMVNQLDGARAVLREVSGFKGVRGVYLMDPRGRTVLSFGPAGEPKLTVRQRENLFGRGRELNLYTEEGGVSVRLLALPVLNRVACRGCHGATNVNGALLIKQRSVDVGSETSFLVAIMLISLMAASLAAALTLLTMLSRKVVSPIREISKATERVAQCDLEVKVPVYGGDEVGELAQAFNRMIGDLKKSRDDVEERSIKCQEAYNSMREAQRKLIQSEKLAAIGTLVAGIAHEINNPVGIIAARTDCMLMEARDKGMDEQCTEDLMVINRHAGRIADITRALLTFARQAPAELLPVDLNGIVEDTLFLVAKQLNKEGIRLERRLSPEGPKVMGNDNRIQQVLLDLLNNARDAVHGEGAITVTTGGSADKAEITVTDTGEGIPEDVLDNIFDPFFTTKEVGKGTGLGLAVSYGIIQDLGGNIEVRSRKGEGATFSITLPRLKES